jgi:hypothetical protein
MSLESKLANLSLGDETSVVAAIKADGVKKSGFADNVVSLIAKVSSDNDDECLAALATIKAVAEEAPEAEAFNIKTLGAILEKADAKNNDVVKAAEETALAICEKITPFAMKATLPYLFSALPVEMPFLKLFLRLLLVCGTPRSRSNLLPLKP